MDREQIVKNGCIGKCCEQFTLPVSFEDIQEMKNFYNREKEAKEQDNPNTPRQKPIVCWNGVERYPPFEEEVDKYLDMLIPLGIIDYDPAVNKPLNEVFSKGLSEDKKKFKGSFRFQDSLKLENTILYSQVFTCRYFDTVKRICTNYENRPTLCKAYGRGCRYESCNFDKVLEKQIIKESSLEQELSI